jgi:hypothetical protein
MITVKRRAFTSFSFIEICKNIADKSTIEKVYHIGKYIKQSALIYPPSFYNSWIKIK